MSWRLSRQTVGPLRGACRRIVRARCQCSNRVKAGSINYGFPLGATETDRRNCDTGLCTAQSRLLLCQARSKEWHGNVARAGSSGRGREGCRFLFKRDVRNVSEARRAQGARANVSGSCGEDFGEQAKLDEAPAYFKILATIREVRRRCRLRSAAAHYATVMVRLAGSRRVSQGGGFGIPACAKPIA